MSNYELIRFQTGGPLKVFIHSVNKFNTHWHPEIEILLILEGSINLRIGNNRYLLRENDLILINSNEIHNTGKTNEKNIILVLQIDPKYYDNYLPGFSKKTFECKLFDSKEEQKMHEIIRHHIAKIVWILSKNDKGNQLLIGSEMLLLVNHLINNFEDDTAEERNTENMNNDIARITSILNFLEKNIQSKVTLKDVADNENLNPYYLSHYIKRVLGISFQEYLNYRRLDIATELLIKTEKTITQIAFESGFPSTKSLNSLIKKEYGCTPLQYREANKKINKEAVSLKPDNKKIKSKTYFDIDRTAALAKLFTYLRTDVTIEKTNNVDFSKVLKVNANKEGTINTFYWKNLATFGRAAEGLRKAWQDQLKELQTDIGFKYIRFHGIFSDEMMICNLDSKGDIVYNWTYVDELFDFFKEVNIKPFVELGFMPTEIKNSDETLFWWKANMSQPKDLRLWINLVKEFTKHCINRYGLREVESWYFEVWNEPDLQYVFWIGEYEEYFQFYKDTVLAIKSISDKIRVGGPAITHQIIKDGTWLEDFLNFCNINDIPLDFASFHIYPETFSDLDEIMEFLEISQEEAVKNFENLKRVYFDENHTYDTLKDIKEKIKGKLPYEPEIHVTEWNVSSYSRNLISDTCFVATFIIRNVLKSIGQVNSLGYWTFTDIMEEFKLGVTHFHGGFGLINKDGLKKPSYYAYCLLSKLGKQIIEQEDDYIITKDENKIQILAYNCTYFDDLFIRGDTSALTNKERYRIYKEKPIKKIQVNIEGIAGKYKIISYQLNRENGSVFDEWVKMGAPQNMTQAEIDYLKGIAQPRIKIAYADIDKEYSHNLTIPVHGVELLEIEKQI